MAAPAEAGLPGAGAIVHPPLDSRRRQAEVSQIEQWRHALFTTVAASALMLYGGRPVRAACTGTAPTLTCTGTITGTSTSNGGVLANNNGFTTINVNSLTANIAPTTGAGISVTNASAISITTDTGNYSIVTNNTTNGDGIFATGAGTTAITINSKGNITTTSGRLGIYARRTGAGAVSVTSQGNISSRTTSIVAQSAGGSLTVNSTGDLTSATAIGIYALTTTNSTQTINVTSTGNINAATWDIFAAASGSGTVTVNSTGNLTTTTTSTGATAAAVYATAASGAVNVTSHGDITATGDTTVKGIYAVNAGAGTINVKNYGSTNGVRTSGIGLFGKSTTGAVQIYSTGKIASTNNRGIAGQATTGSVTINNKSYIRSATNTSGTPTGTTTNIGIEGLTTGTGAAAAVSITNNANITAFAQGILARTTGATTSGAITVTSTGDITSVSTTAYATITGGLTSAGSTMAAITAMASNGAAAVNVTSVGNLSSGTLGIYARSGGAGAVAVTNNSGNSSGTISARTTGIAVLSNGGNVTIDSTGSVISTTAIGLYASTTSTGAAKVTNKGAITATTVGIFARSTGAGAVTVDSTGDIANSATTGTLGIYARNSGAGAVYVKNNGYINVRQTGIYARSSDGGNATVVSTGNIKSATRAGIYSGSATGNVSVDSTGDITTPTQGGIVAINSGGAATTVSVKSNGAITSYFEGIYAKSTSGAISVESTGDVTSTFSTAIKTVGGTSSTVKVNAGSTVYGIYRGVVFSGGGTNTLNNFGSISSNTYTVAVQGTTGNETINNYNLITGNVDLGTGTNAFNNKSTGIFVSSSSVNLNGGTLTNDGNLTPGGLGVVQTTAVTGSFVQTSTGVFTVDIDHSSSDVLNVSGTITFDGKVFANVFALPSASGGTMIADATSVTLAPTATASGTSSSDFSLQVVAGNELWLTWVPIDIFDLFTDAITPNQQAIGLYLNALRLSSDTSAGLLALITAVKALPSEADVLAALDRLQPEHYLAQVNDTWISTQFFAQGLMSCPTATGENSVVVEDQCLWARIGGRVFDQDHTRTNIGGDDTVYTISAGAQVALDETWRFGFAGSYEETELSTTNKARSDGQRGLGGVVLKNRWGPASLALAAFGGYGTFDTHRTIGLVGVSTADGSDDIRFGGGHSRLAIVQQDDDEGLYVKLMWDLDATYLEYGGFNETNGGVAGLHIASTGDWVLGTMGAVELGANLESEAATLRPFVRAGVSVVNDADFSLTSNFLSAPAGVSPFTITSRFDNAYLDVAAGVDLITTGGLELKLNYDGRFSDNSELHAGSLKAGVRF